MLELASETISEDMIDDLIVTMFKSAGLNHKSEIHFDDFSRLMNDYQTEFNSASLSWEGKIRVKFQLHAKLLCRVYLYGKGAA